VDILYRDLDAIAAVARAGVAGRPRIAYQPGHPHGFITAIYLAEIALCRPLWDPEGVVADLKRLADTPTGGLPSITGTSAVPSS